MKLPIDCRYAAKPPRQYKTLLRIHEGEIACCRSHLRALLDTEHPPLCRVVADEVYRLSWLQAFGEHAVVCIARNGDDAALERWWYPSMFGQGERSTAPLSMTDWRRLQDAVIAANFWSLPPLVTPRGVYLDGWDVIVEGRRKDVFRATTLHNPDADELGRLGRVAFDLAGLSQVRL